MYNDGELKNFSSPSWDSGISLDNSETYIITHYFDGSTEYFRALKKGGSLQTASNSHSYADDTYANFWWGAGNTSSPNSLHT